MLCIDYNIRYFKLLANESGDRIGDVSLLTTSGKLINLGVTINSDYYKESDDHSCDIVWNSENKQYDLRVKFNGGDAVYTHRYSIDSKLNDILRKILNKKVGVNKC